MGKRREPALAPAYLCLVPRLAEVAQEHGYALAVHGSMQRDLDLLAVPWTEHACGPTELVGALFDRVKWASENGGPEGPTEMPHGRLAWTIALGGGAYIDLSVMPRAR